MAIYRHRLEDQFDFQITPHVDPLVECIFLLNRRYGQLSDIPNNIATLAKQICDRYEIPTSALQHEIDILSKIEEHVLNNLSAPKEQLEFFFTYTEGILANLAWGLYFLEQEHIDFACLSAEGMLQELHHLLCIALNCPPEALLRCAGHAVPCTLFRELSLFPAHQMDQSSVLVQTGRISTSISEHPPGSCRSVSGNGRSFDPLLEAAAPGLAELFSQKDQNNVLQKLAPHYTGPVILRPSAIWFNGMGIVWDHTRSDSSEARLFTGILYQPLVKLTQQYRNSSELIANGTKTLGDVRRVEILKALKNQSLCNQDLADLLNLCRHSLPPYELSNPRWFCLRQQKGKSCRLLPEYGKSAAFLREYRHITLYKVNFISPANRRIRPRFPPSNRSKHRRDQISRAGVST